MEKALIIAYNDLNNSGVPNVIYQTIKAFHEQYDFDVLIFGNDDYYFQKLLSEEIRIELIKCLDQKPKGKISRLFWWFYKRPHNHYLFMKELLKKNHYSIVHSFKEYDSWPFFKAAKENGIKNRILHRNVNPTKPNQPIIKILESKNRRFSIKYSSKLIGVSEACCKNAFRNKEYKVLYNSYDEQKYNMEVPNNLLKDELVITQTASYSDNKNQLFALQVLKELKKMHDNTKLNLVGATNMDSFYQKLMDYVSTNDLENDVSFIKRSDSVDKIYKSTTFIIVPSLREGFSLVTIEAQACGIIAFASTNVTSEVDCGGVRFLDLSKGPKYWAENIYNEFINRGNNRSRFNVEKFSFDRFRNQLISIYRNN